MIPYPQPQTRPLPIPPKLTKAIGVGIVVMGMAMGTGELIMWPHLVTKHGLGILWLALIGITLQFVINHEVARHAAASGESFFFSSGRALSWSPLFWLGAGVLLYIWPGWASVLGTVAAKLFGAGDYLLWAYASLGLLLLITFLGRAAYLTLERTLKIIVPAFLLLLVAVSFLNLSGSVLLETARGLVRFGHIPADIDVAVLLGAIVFAGAGGMLNLCVSFWYRDKGVGMGEYVERIENPITGKLTASAVHTYRFDADSEQVRRWRGWMRYIRIDQGIIFWLLGIISILLVSANAFAVLVPQGLVPEGTQVAVLQAEIFREHFGAAGEKVYLAMAYLMLFSVMWTVLDALTRIVSDILHTHARVGAFTRLFGGLKNVSIHKLYYVLIVLFVAAQAILLPFKQPFTFLVISSVLGGITMAIYTPLLIYINNTRLPKAIKPGILMNGGMAFAAAFYIYFSVRILAEYL
jgi:hypothetical protein